VPCDDFGLADDAAALEFGRIWDVDAVVRTDGITLVVFRLGHALTGVDEDGPALALVGIVFGPIAVFIELVAVGDEPCPRLADGEGFHGGMVWSKRKGAKVAEGSAEMIELQFGHVLGWMRGSWFFSFLTGFFYLPIGGPFRNFNECGHHCEQ